MNPRKSSHRSQPKASATRDGEALYARIRGILESARSSVARTVNTTQVVANWLIGREIVEEEQKGAKRAIYGKTLLADISRRLHLEFGTGYSVDNLEWFRAFYRGYPSLISRVHSPNSPGDQKSDAPRRKLPAQSSTLYFSEIQADGVSAAKWEPGRLSSRLSWTHYRALVRVGSIQARTFYEIEAIKNTWSARELERQINSLLFERLAKSRDKAGLMKLATKGQEIATPADVFKDPVVMEFLGLPASHRLVETKLEEALIANLQKFLLELGKGFAFMARQERLTLEGDHFYVDLVFYHTILKCHVLVDLKVRKLTHQDLGQMQLYVNYYDQERCTPGDNPTLGLILCTDHNETAVRYTLGTGRKKIFASRYQLHLPSEAELALELKRELKRLR